MDKKGWLRQNHFISHHKREKRKFVKNPDQARPENAFDGENDGSEIAEMRHIKTNHYVENKSTNLLHRLSPRQGWPFSRSSPKVYLAGIEGTLGMPLLALGTTLRASAALVAAGAVFLDRSSRELLEPEPMARTL